ncbi:MAG: guanylate kinase [Candidatus Saccharibacteria bacterium]|nr:guanylate kinase [Candidatus Saccharibacteria bacterium]
MHDFSLRHYQVFKDALQDYRMSEHAKKTLKDLRLVLMVAATSTGRNTLIRHLERTGRYHYITSDTTRPPRINDGILEQTGKEYWFRTEEEVLADLLTGKFLEAELIHDQQVSGISIRELEKAKQEEKTAITDIELGGIQNILNAKPDTIAIMLLPPSFEQWQQRIARRGVMSAEEYSRRLKTADRIFEDGLNHDYYQFVIARDVDKSASIIDSLAAGGPNPDQIEGKKLVVELHRQLQATEL